MVRMLRPPAKMNKEELRVWQFFWNSLMEPMKKVFSDSGKVNTDLKVDNFQI